MHLDRCPVAPRVSRECRVQCYPIGWSTLPSIGSAAPMMSHPDVSRSVRADGDVTEVLEAYLGHKLPPLAMADATGNRLSAGVA